MAFKMRGYSPFTRKTDPPKKKDTTGFEEIMFNPHEGLSDEEIKKIRKIREKARKKRRGM